MFVFSSATIKNVQKSPRRHFGILIGISIACWVLIALLLWLRMTVIRVPIAQFPYEPILRSTTTVDDVHPLSVPETERNQVFVQATVPPVRTVVLDAHGAISEIWSNTAGNVYHYTLYVRRQSVDGPHADYSPTVHSQYAALIPLVDWRPSGRVFPAPERSENPIALAAPADRNIFR